MSEGTTAWRAGGRRRAAGAGGRPAPARDLAARRARRDGDERREALVYARRAARYDALFLDVRMPEIEGIELARLLRRFDDPPGGRVPDRPRRRRRRGVRGPGARLPRQAREPRPARVRAGARRGAVAAAPHAPAPRTARPRRPPASARPRRRRGRQPQGRRQAPRPPGDDPDRAGQRRLRAHPLRRRGASSCATPLEPAREGLAPAASRACTAPTS